MEPWNGTCNLLIWPSGINHDQLSLITLDVPGEEDEHRLINGRRREIESVGPKLSRLPLDYIQNYYD